MKPRRTVLSAALTLSVLLLILGMNNELVMLQLKADKDVAAAPPPTYLSGTGKLPFKVSTISAANFPRMIPKSMTLPTSTTSSTDTTSKPRILFLCLTRSSTHSKRGAKQFSTWGNVAVQGGHKFVYVVNEPDYESFVTASTGDEGYTFWTPALPAEAKEKDGYKGAQHRFIGALTYPPLDLLGLDASTTWVMLVDDDTFVLPNVLAEWINNRSDGAKWVEMGVYGEFKCTSKKTLCGGGGVLFSPMALRNLQRLLSPELKKEVQIVGPGFTEGSWHYDVWLTLLMRSHPADFKVSGSEFRLFSTLPPDHWSNVDRRKRGIKIITYHRMERYGYERAMKQFLK